jgi:hypothetical protein
MDKEQESNRCNICGVVIADDSTICAECEGAFEPGLLVEATGEEPLLDVEQYCSRMFPWEQSQNRPRLIIFNKTWLILSIGLAVIVLLLALIRAPLPGCWELS